MAKNIPSNIFPSHEVHNYSDNDDDSDVSQIHISGLSSFHFTDFETGGDQKTASSKETNLKLDLSKQNDGKSDDESKLFSQFLKKSSTPLSPENSLNESTLSLAKLEALEDDIDENFLQSQTEEVERNVTQYLNASKLPEEKCNSQNSEVILSNANGAPQKPDETLMMNQTEKDSFILKDVKARFGLNSVNETSLSLISSEPFQRRLKQRQSDLNREAERLAGQIMIERPNLDGSSSDSEDNVTISSTSVCDTRTMFGIVDSLPNNPNHNVQNQLEYLNLDTVPERQSAEGRGNTDPPFTDGGGGGDGSSGHSEDDVAGNGSVSISNQRLVPVAEHANSDDDRITPPNRERPVGGSENNRDIGIKQVQFAANLRSLSSSSPNLSNNDNLVTTLTEQNVNLDETPCDEESRLSSRYFLAASTPFLAASTFSDQSPDYESRTMRLEDFQDEGSIFNNVNDTLTNDVNGFSKLCKEKLEKQPSGQGLGDASSISCFAGNMTEEFKAINQDFEGMLEEDEKLVAESNDTIVGVDETGISEWSVRTDNVCINPELLPSVNSTNSDGNVSRYFKFKSNELGKSLSKKGSRPKFSDATLSITSPEKGSPVKLIEETVVLDPFKQPLRNKDSAGRKSGTVNRPDSPVFDGRDVSTSSRKLSDTSKKSRARSSVNSRRGSEKSKSDVNNSEMIGKGFPPAGQIPSESFSIPVCRQEAGTLLHNIQERRVSIVGIGETEMEQLAKIIASLTGSDVKVVYKVLQIMSKVENPNISSKMSLFMNGNLGHASKLNGSFMHAPVSTTSHMHPHPIGDTEKHIPSHSCVENMQPSEDMYHTLYPSVDRDSFARVPPTLNTNTNTYKLAAVTPYQIVSSHASPINSRREYSNIYASNESMSSVSSGGSVTYSRPNMQFNDAISYTSSIDFGFCCIGEKNTKIFKMYNSNSCWIQVHFNIVFFAYNGCENSDHHTEPFIINPTKVVVGPNSAEEVKIKFLPKQTGSFTMKVELVAGSLVDADDTNVNWPRLPKLLNVEGICELPDLEVALGDEKCVDFGEVPYGTVCIKELSILNRGRADIPLKLSICSSLSTVAFSFENSATVLSVAGNPPVATTFVKGQGEGGGPIKPTVVVIKFNSPHRPPGQNRNSNSLPEEYSCQLDIRSDTEETILINRVLMKAAVGFLRLHSLRTLQPICLNSVEGNQCEETIPLRNAGNLTLNLAVKLCGSTPFFSISPSYLKLSPGEESEIKVYFAPSIPAYVESILKVSILPDGDEYEWTLKGKSSKSVPTSSRGSKPALLCNTQALNWPGVPIGQSQQKKLILRNSSDNQNIHLSLSIAGDHANFQVVNDVRFTQKDMNKFDTVIHPGGELPVHVLFLPTYLHIATSSLVIRTLDGIGKSVIPLSGYGGKSQLDISGANNLHNQFWIDMDEVYLGKKNIMNLILRNNGTRATFVSIKCFADITARIEYPSSHVCITPNNFILKEKVSTQITLSYQPLQDHAKKLQEGTYTSAHLVIYSGDEVLRKAFRKHNNGVHGDPVVTMLDNYFMNEENVNEEVSFTTVSDWNNFLLSCIGKTVIALVARYPTESAEVPSQDKMQEMMTHITPAQKLKTSTDSKTQLNDIWTVSPEKVVLNTVEEGSSCKIKMINYSNKVISFEFIWPGQTLVITPCKDKIPARSQLLIKVSAKKSFLSGAEDLPWRGNIYVLCNGEQKGVEVEIGNDAVSEQSPMLPAKDMVAISPNDVSIIPHLGTSNEKVIEKHITVSPPVLEFQKTKIGSASESFVTIKNRLDVPCAWSLISIAPPYCKCLDGNSGITRVTYTAFRFSKQTGTLQGKEGLKLFVSFHPCSEGMYSQFWEIQSSSDNNLTATKTRLEVNGQGHLSVGKTSSETTQIACNNPTNTLASGKSTVGNEKKTNRSMDKSQMVYVKDSLLTFPQTNVGDKRSMQFRLCNRSEKMQKVQLTGVKEPFDIEYTTLKLNPKIYVRVPIYYSPQVANTVSQGSVNIVLEDDSIITVTMMGKSS